MLEKHYAKFMKADRRALLSKVRYEQGDRWDQMIKVSDKHDRQTRMDLILNFTARALINNQPIDEKVRQALAESLLRIGNGEDPRDVFGPIKGKRKPVSERHVTL